MTIPFEEWDVPAVSAAENTEKTTARRRNRPMSLTTPNRFPEKKAADRLLYYISIGSGSSGNCCYLGTRRGGILIDAGVKTDKVESVLTANGIKMSMVKAVLLTHDHSDHVRYAYGILRSHKHIRLFCTNRVVAGILRRTSISKRIREYHHAIFKEIPFRIRDFEITAFDVPR